MSLLQSLNLYLSTPKLSALCGQPIKLRRAYEGPVTHKELNAFSMYNLGNGVRLWISKWQRNHDLEQMAKPQATEATEFSAIPRG